MHESILEPRALTMHVRISERSVMKSPVLLGWLACLVVVTQASFAQETASSEKIRDISPDKKFAMQISYDAEMNKQLVESEKTDPDKIFSETIKAIELVTLP